MNSTIATQVQDKIKELLEEPNLMEFDQNFYEIGGNSLLAMDFLGFIYKQFNVELNIKDLFTKSINDIAGSISA